MRKFDGEYFASVYWNIFLRLTFALVLLYSIAHLFMTTARPNMAQDLVNIVICTTFFGMLFWEKTKYEEKLHNLCMVVFFVANLLFYLLG